MYSPPNPNERGEPDLTPPDLGDWIIPENIKSGLSNPRSLIESIGKKIGL
jgi:hypothetical protein